MVKQKERKAPVLYVVEFDDDCVKVGRTAYSDRVLRRYQSDGVRWNREVTKHWVSEPHFGNMDTERQLKQWCRQISTPRNGHGSTRVDGTVDRGAGGEFFDDLSFDDAVSHAEFLISMQRPWQEPVQLTGTLDVDWYHGTVTVKMSDGTVTVADMSEPTWLVQLALLDPQGLLPHFMSMLRQAGNTIPPMLREAYGVIED